MKTALELPEDPLKMPPPYWRSSGTVFQILSALSDLVQHLESLTEIHSEVESNLTQYFKNNPEIVEDDEEFLDITEPLWEIEHKIKLKCELAVFMTAIHLEDRLNMVIAYNLDKAIAEISEKLSPSEKLQMLAILLTKESVKGKRPFEAVKNFSSWRNAYAHGHCTDRPTKSLRHNHLIKPVDYPSVPKELEFLKNRIDDYLVIKEYLSSISINKYTKSNSVEDDEIKFLINKIKKFGFKYEGNGDVYELFRN